MKKGMRYYLSRNLFKKKDQKEFLTLDRIEDLLSGFKQMVSYLVEDLAFRRKEMEAVGIMRRNEVESYVREDVHQKLSAIQYNPDKDSSLKCIDSFSPMSQPLSDYLTLPQHVKLNWIGSDQDVEKLADLLQEKYIGVDSEWRPELT